MTGNQGLMNYRIEADKSDLLTQGNTINVLNLQQRNQSDDDPVKDHY